WRQAASRLSTTGDGGAPVTSRWSCSDNMHCARVWLCAAILTRLPRKLFDGLENQPDASFFVPKRSVQDHVEWIRRVPIGMVKLADGVRAALILLPHPPLGLGPADTLAVHDVLNPECQGCH